MTDKHTSRSLRREYFTACGLAVVAAFIGMASPSVTPSDLPVSPDALLAFVVLFGGAVAVFFALAIRPDSSGADEGESCIATLPARRMVKMATLWYGLSILLSAALVRGPLLFVLGRLTLRPMPVEAALAMAGLAITLVALWRLIMLYRNNATLKGGSHDG